MNTEQAGNKELTEDQLFALASSNNTATAPAPASTVITAPSLDGHSQTQQLLQQELPPEKPAEKVLTAQDSQGDLAGAQTPHEQIDELAKLREEHIQLQSRLRTQDGMLKGQGAELRELRQRVVDKTSAPAPSAAAPTTSPVEETLDVLRQLQEQAPTVAEAVKLLVEKEVASRTQNFQEQLKTVSVNHEALELERHIAAIEAKHANFEQVIVSNAFKVWMDSLPPFARKGIADVAEQGTASEVIEVLDDFTRAQRPQGGQQPAAHKAPPSNYPAASRFATAPSRSAAMATTGAALTEDEIWHRATNAT